MARHEADDARKPQQLHVKLPKLPKNAVVTKRPLLHPAPPSKYAGPSSQKTVYISSRSRFMSAVAQVERALSQVEKRAQQSTTALLKNESRQRKRKFGQVAGGDDEVDIGEVARRLALEKKEHAGEADLGKEEVVVRATGKAIEKALRVAGWFMAKEGYGVQVKTGSVAAIDDIEVKEEDNVAEVANEASKEDADEAGVQEEIPETRVRHASTVQIAVYKT